MGERDDLGQRGEMLFQTLITRFHPERGFLFRPAFLGDKWPTVDFVVELIGASIPAYLFVQVRTTREGLTQRQQRLKIKVPAGKVRALAAYPAPTYLVGIDAADEAGYIVSVRGETRGLSSLSTAFPLDAANRLQLWQEVEAFWTAAALSAAPSAFRDAEWK